MTDATRSGAGSLPDAGRPASRRAGLVQKAAADWKNALVDLGGRNNLLHYRDLKLGTLDLTAADRDVVRGLLLGKVIEVTTLFKDPAQSDQVLRRVRTIHNKAKENLEERGLETLSLACGLATWRGMERLERARLDRYQAGPPGIREVEPWHDMTPRSQSVARPG